MAIFIQYLVIQKCQNAWPSIGSIWQNFRKIRTFKSLKIIRARSQTAVGFKMAPGVWFPEIDTRPSSNSSLYGTIFLIKIII